MASHDDAEAVCETVVSVAHHIDRKGWAELRQLFADEVTSDYTSLFGGTPQTQPADVLVGNWRDTLGVVATQHLLGPIRLRVAGLAAHASCHVRAMHHAPKAPGGPIWEVLGHYEFELTRAGAGWKISRMTLHTFMQTGNTKLLAEAPSAG